MSLYGLIVREVCTHVRLISYFLRALCTLLDRGCFPFSFFTVPSSSCSLHVLSWRPRKPLRRASLSPHSRRPMSETCHSRFSGARWVCQIRPFFSAW